MDPILLWAIIFISVAVMLYVSRKNIWIALFTGGLILLIPVILETPAGIPNIIYKTFLDAYIFILAIAVGLIALIGGLLEIGGQMSQLVDNLPLRRRTTLALSPAMIGMLPMPGGALLSAPLVDKLVEPHDPEAASALNVWFRHVLFLIYPLGTALLISAAAASLDVYAILVYMFPFFIFSIIIGYFFLLRKFNNDKPNGHGYDKKALLMPVIALAIAPILDFSLKRVVPIASLATLIGVIVSLGFSLYLIKMDRTIFRKAVNKMKPWDFSLIIFGMMFYMYAFIASGASSAIASMSLPPPLLISILAFILGFITGRIQSPMLILIPIFLAQYGSMTPFSFAVAFISVFTGYVISPIHPCVSVTARYFNVSIKSILSGMLKPAILLFLSAFIASFFI